MKTKITFILLALLNTHLFFGQITVALHSPANGVQFFSDDHPLQSAYTAAVDNDTIYLPGGSMLPPAKFEKKLVIYGAGHYPSATTATRKTYIQGDVNLSDEADGFHLEGVEISGSIRFDDNEPINNVVIKRCKMNDININGDMTTPSESVLLIENVFRSGDFRNLTNSIVYNNIITGTINRALNLTFLNNIFLYNGYRSYYVIGYASNALFKNNIFIKHYYDNRICDGAGASTWSNNAFVAASPTLGTNSTTSNNYYSVVMSALFNTAPVDDTFDYANDYSLQNPASYPGDDGTQIGIYGGFHPWKGGSVPVNPHISSVNISATSNSSGQLHIDINVHAQDQ